MTHSFARLSGRFEFTEDGDTVTIHLPSWNLEVPKGAFDEMAVTSTLDPAEVLFWDCGCANAGIFYCMAGFIMEAEQNNWRLAQVAAQYKQKALKHPEAFPSAAHPRLMEGLHHVATQLVQRDILAKHPFSR